VNIDDNLEIDANGGVVCRHCRATIGDASSDPLAAAMHSERPAVDAGPGVHADPSHYTSREIVLRCKRRSCLKTNLDSEIGDLIN
jgi:hypothetical protein